MIRVALNVYKYNLQCYVSQKQLFPFSKKKDKFDDSEFEKKRLKFLTESETYYQEGKYLYYKDRWNRVKKLDTSIPTPKHMVRLRIFELPYRWWINKTPDVQNAIIPIFLSLLIGMIIYNGSNYFIEREEAMIDKGRVPEHITQDSFNKWKSEKQSQQQNNQ